MSKHIGFFSWLFFPHFRNFNLISNFSTWTCARCRNFRHGFPVSPHTPREREARSQSWVAGGGRAGACVCILHAGTSVCTAPSTEGQVEGRGRGDPGVQGKQLLSGCGWSVASARGESFQGLSFPENGWCPGFRQGPTPFPGHSQGSGLHP